MKVRESGMPGRTMWQSFFNPEEVLDKLGLGALKGDVVDFGCGYGTFSIPAASRTIGDVHALDLDPSVLKWARKQSISLNIQNLHFYRRDFIANGTGLADGSMDYAMIFNLLHLENPACLLVEAHRILNTNGRLGIIHWIDDPQTPRGPPLAIRPKPKQCQQWASQAGFIDGGLGIVDLAPYHYGLVFRKQKTTNKNGL